MQALFMSSDFLHFFGKAGTADSEFSSAGHDFRTGTNENRWSQMQGAPFRISRFSLTCENLRQKSKE
jgi:hypothetical protein